MTIHASVKDVVSRVDQAAEIALAIAGDATMQADDVKVSNVRVQACNAVTKASSMNIRSRLAAPKLAEIEKA